MPAPPCGNYGDVSGDGNVATDDAMRVAQYLAGMITLTSDQLSRANVKGYGSVSQEDVDLISNYAVGNITTFPVCGMSNEHIMTFIIPIGSMIKVDGVEVI
jgi:hypothetical protein